MNKRPRPVTPYSFRLRGYANRDGDAFTTLAELTPHQREKTVVALKYLTLAWHLVSHALEPSLAHAYRQQIFVGALLCRTLAAIQEFQAAVPSSSTRRRFFGEAVADFDSHHSRVEPIEYMHGHTAFVWNINYLETEAAIEELYKTLHGEEADPTPAVGIWLACWNGSEKERAADEQKDEPPVESNDAAC